MEKITLKDLAGYISESLRRKGIETILVGGACVTIYSENRYQSYDLDFVTYEDMGKVKKALNELGFKEKSGYFQHLDCEWFIEFVSPPVAVGKEFIKTFGMIRTSLGCIKMLTALDSVKDRLSSYYHWADKQGLQQAINICLEQEIDLKALEKWSLDENKMEKFNDFFYLYNKEISK